MKHTPLPRPLTLIHGWGADARVWGQLPQQLQARLGVPVNAIDLPGYGKNQPNPDLGGVSVHEHRTDFAAQAADLAACLPLGGSVCAWSLGAQLALQIAATCPERVGRLILVGASPRFVQPAAGRSATLATTDAAGCPGLPPDWLAAFRRALTDDPAAARRRFVALMHQGDPQARALSRQMSAQVLSAPQPASTALLAGLDWLANNDLSPLLAQIQQPAWLLHGEHDPLMPIAAARWLAGQLPNARLQVFANCAHAPFLSAPDAFIAALAAIFQEPA